MQIDPLSVIEGLIKNEVGPKRQAHFTRLLMGAALVEATLVGPEEGPSQACPFVDLIENYGVDGDRHAHCMTQLSVRDEVLVEVMGLVKRSRTRKVDGTPAANTRQVTLVSRQESDHTIKRMYGADATMPLGAQVENLMISLPYLSQVPAGSVITFVSPNGERRTASLIVTGENQPCGEPHANLVRYFDQKPKVGYMRAALGRRGLTAIVKTGGHAPAKGGRVHTGDIAAFWLPH